MNEKIRKVNIYNFAILETTGQDQISLLATHLP